MKKVDLVIGLQAGSEGKGRVIETVAHNYGMMIRTGAPNAGHKVWLPVTDTGEHKQYAFQSIPCGCIANPSAQYVIGAGGMIIEDILRREINLWQSTFQRSIEHQLKIDPNVMIIEQKHMDQERDPNLTKLGDLSDCIGSTREGVGAAAIDRIRRDGSIKRACDVDWLKRYVIDTIPIVHGFLQIDPGPVLIEGTQGQLLDIYHGYYPYCTSRSTGAANWLAEVGVSPLQVRHIVGVMRTYPIRVGGNSGPLAGEELSWEDLTARAGAPVLFNERTTVTNKFRRIFEFDVAELYKSLLINRPTAIAINFADYIDFNMYGVNNIVDITDKFNVWHKGLIEQLPELPPIYMIGTGPKLQDIVYFETQCRFAQDILSE